MYVILVNEDNTLTTTQKERIMQRSKLVDTLWFLVSPTYKGRDISQFTVMMEYILPVSKKYCSEILSLSEEMHNDHLKYTLPFDTALTSEAGDIEVQLTFACVELDANGKSVQLVRKVDPTTITICPITAWSDIIPDSALSAIDQRLIMADAQIKALNEISDVLLDTKADNLRYNSQTSELQLVAGNKAIGNKVVIVSCDDTHDGEADDCIPVVEF